MNNGSNETLGQRIARLRHEAGMTQQQLADAAGVPVRTLQGWEQDRREPASRELYWLARGLVTTTDNVLGSLDRNRPARVPGKRGRPRNADGGEQKGASS